MATHKFTIGIEEEFQIIDPNTYDLVSHMHQVIEGSELILKEQVKAEMHTAVVEVGTAICQDIGEARREVLHLRRVIAENATKNGLTMASAGTHPFARWQDQPITNMQRYDEIVAEMGDVARSNLIFGLHVHVGIPNREVGVHLMNAARYFLPHIFALSTNSPFWEGRHTGFKSFRTKVFDKFPRTGIPDTFSSASEYDNYINLLIKTNCIDNGKKIWWDLRLHPIYETLEFRICDAQLRADETIALAALIQAIMFKLYKLHNSNLTFRVYNRNLINENKWRAARLGIDGKMIDFGKAEEVNTRSLIHELFDFVDDVVDELGSRHEVGYIFQMLDNGTGADRQLSKFKETNDLNEVMKYIISETYHGL